MSVHTENFEDALAVELWREDRAEESSELLKESLAEMPEVDHLVLLTHRLAMAERTRANHAEALRLLLEIFPRVPLCKDELIKGKFYLGLAVTLQEIGESEGVGVLTDRAFIEYEQSRFHYQCAGEFRRCGIVENNIAVLLISTGKPDEAFAHIEKAKQLAPEHIAQIEDTEARAYLKLNNTDLAIKAATSSVSRVAGTNEILLYRKSFETLCLAVEAKKREQRVERIRQALISGGSVAQAARILGMSRQAVEDWIRRFPELEGYAKRRARTK